MTSLSHYKLWIGNNFFPRDKKWFSFYCLVHVYLKGERFLPLGAAEQVRWVKVLFNYIVYQNFSFFTRRENME